jgi:DNA repair exonuclease SbcCD nuclease subunit
MSYVVVSDIHCHPWTVFNKPTATGINGRLRIILDELKRSAAHAISIGAKFIVIAGDILHKRGEIKPEVLNPLQKVIAEILDMGLDIYAIPGNHDLAGEETDELGNAMMTLGQTKSDHGRFIVVDKPMTINTGEHMLGFVPWRSKISDLIEDLECMSEACQDVRQFMDVFIHAGINGVLSGFESELTAPVLAKLGFRNVFAGHYHNFKEFEGGVWSIGALTHQTYSDIGSKAGFLSVDGEGVVTHYGTHAPRFVDVTDYGEEMMLAADGNYVRFSSTDLTQEEINELRKAFIEAGAQGVSILAPKKTPATRRTGTAATGKTVDESVSNYVDGVKDFAPTVDTAKVKAECAAILSDVRTVLEEA